MDEERGKKLEECGQRICEEIYRAIDKRVQEVLSAPGTSKDVTVSFVSGWRQIKQGKTLVIEWSVAGPLFSRIQAGTAAKVMRKAGMEPVIHGPVTVEELRRHCAKLN